MKILIAFSHELDGKILLENATEEINGPYPTIEELTSIKRWLRTCGAYQNVVILNWMAIKED